MSERITDEELARILETVPACYTWSKEHKAIRELQERRRVEREALGPVVRLSEGWEDQAVSQ